MPYRSCLGIGFESVTVEVRRLSTSDSDSAGMRDSNGLVGTGIFPMDAIARGELVV